VLPQNWLYLGWYERYRRALLANSTWLLVARLGTGAFETVSGEVVNVCLFVSSARKPGRSSHVSSLDLQAIRGSGEKAAMLKTAPIKRISQSSISTNPDARFISEAVENGRPLSEYADSTQGICTGDYSRFGRYFWEVPALNDGSWFCQQSTVTETQPFGGREHALLWEDGAGQLKRSVSERLGIGGEGAWLRGLEFLGSKGVVISQSGALKACLYLGDLLDNNAAAIIPKDPALLPALWGFCSSPEFNASVRRIDASLKVTNRTLLKVPFDVDRWRRVAEEAGALPEPSSEDPTQWLFEGQPEASNAPLQVAVVRVVGYRWPKQPTRDELEVFADADGIVCLPAVSGEAPAAERLNQALAAAFGDALSSAMVKELLERTGSKKKTLADWLRDEFFRQHCSLFGNRPFVWHIWDGQRDGFSALVHYHRLDRRLLEKLTYTYLGQDWVERQRAAARDEVAGADARLSAALELQRKLEAILEGEQPYDIYARWKEIHAQPIGWEPDLDDGVRVNIRPFVEAGITRSPVKIHWKKDRGANPDGSERHNDVHLSLAQKRAARQRAGRT
jgi:hypothetical protein